MLNKISQTVIDVGSQLLKWRNVKSVDLLAHKQLVLQLKIINPNIPIISEENPQSWMSKRPKRYWLIDPLDGTASFIKGYSGFVTQIAFIESNKAKLAAVYAPVLKELFKAEYKKGAYLNKKRLSIIKKDKFETLIDNYPTPRGIAKKAFVDFKFKKYIECGSFGLKMCKIADGSADLFIKDVAVRDWDIAAPHLVLQEVGGILTDIDGNKFNYQGGFVHKGLIATSSEKFSEKVINWYNKNIK